jgi:hypothetical protein
LQDKLTAGENIKIASNVISANNVFIITESDVTVSTDPTKWVAPYNTSYGYTNIDISASAGIEWREWAIYTFVVNTEMVVASAYRNVRVKIWTWAYIPVMWTTAALAGHSYFTKANTRQYQYSTKYESWWALHLFTDSNTTYSAMSVAEWQTATATSVRGMRSDYLKQIIKYHSVDDTAYANTWDWVTDLAPSKNAVYDKISSMDSSISTINWKIPSAATSSNQLADKNYVNDSINSVTAYYITKNAQGDQFATHAELTAATTFYSGWVVRTPTRNDYTIVLADEDHDNATTRYIYNSGWEYQYTVNETALTQAQLDALNSWITAAKVSTYDGYASWKQDTLTTQTAYTTKGTSTKVPTITTNNLGQVTAITETDIAFPVTSVNGSTWAVTVSEFNPWGTATTWYVLKKTADGYGWDAESWAVTSVNGQTWAVTVTEFSPSNAGSADQVLTKTAWGYEWANASWWIENDTTGTTTSVTKIRAWSSAEYESLGSKNSSTIYYIF